MAFARINDVLLHYRLAGRPDAPALLLANSLGTDARIWDAVIELLADDYRILSYDKRGHGLSDAPSGDYALDDHVGDLLGLADLVGFERFALAGVSVGGLIAQGFALAHPQRLAALVLCDTAPKLGDAAGWNSRINAIGDNGMASIADMVMERWFTPGFRRDRPDELAGWRNLFLRSDAVGYCGTCATLRDTDLTAQIAAITTPTLVVVGAEDQSTPVEMVRAGTATIPGVKFKIIADAGHIPSIEQPAQLAAAMRGHFREAGHG